MARYRRQGGLTEVSGYQVRPSPARALRADGHHLGHGGWWQRPGQVDGKYLGQQQKGRGPCCGSVHPCHADVGGPSPDRRDGEAFTAVQRSAGSGPPAQPMHRIAIVAGPSAAGIAPWAPSREPTGGLWDVRRFRCPSPAHAVVDRGMSMAPGCKGGTSKGNCVQRTTAGDAGRARRQLRWIGRAHGPASIRVRSLGETDRRRCRTRAVRLDPGAGTHRGWPWTVVPPFPLRTAQRAGHRCGCCGRSQRGRTSRAAAAMARRRRPVR